MNTGAEDESRNTPIFAFRISSARAIPLTTNASKPASARRANFVIQFPPSSSILDSDTRGSKRWPHYLGNGGEPPLPLWGDWGEGSRSLCMIEPSPGSHLSMRSDLSHKGRGDDTDHAERLRFMDPAL